MPEAQTTTPPNDDRFLWCDLAASAQVVFNDSRASLLEQLDAAVAHCGKQAARYGAKAEFQLKVAFKPDGRDAIKVEVSLVAKTPTPGSLPVPAFINRKGELCKDDPTQGALFEMRGPRDVAAKEK